MQIVELRQLSCQDFRLEVADFVILIPAVRSVVRVAVKLFVPGLSSGMVTLDKSASVTPVSSCGRLNGLQILCSRSCVDILLFTVSDLPYSLF